MVLRIDATGLHYTPLNRQVRAAVRDGETEIVIDNVLGQRFIADGLCGEVRITVNGVPGGDLGMFMRGPTVIVNGNADHAPGNTMDGGTIIIHGSAGDAVAHSMRGGRVFVRDDIGYRGGIHMKEYEEKRPCLVVGGSARSYLGEYMAGGIVLLLRLGDTGPFVERGIASGIHGGEVYIRGEVDPGCLAIGAKVLPLDEERRARIRPLIEEFCRYFGEDPAPLIAADYTRIGPASARPFAGKYVWE
ncbi:GltB/FmdC/FwdC-like GXGXG domain-containing protein [Methanofollis fontis]|uniref:Glutamate synthase alpha subunit C-terminal domain-containing protein n=1 Tax=Methanofollis fontis TaxID=2052832 RepID=A0A483CU31_9EURY|nr:hypothetical protein [Methanofollis fontis]TAJ44943.1 hypothetical protein CUJ86_06595 [Methanofollis fontis]